MAVRIAPCIVLMACGLCLAGCSTLGKKSPGSAASGGADAQNRGIPHSPAAALGMPRPHPSALPFVPPTAGANGFLAGQVLDKYNRRLPGGQIQVVEADDPQKGSAIEVPVDGQGYFTIQGLQSGRRYQLIVRAQNGSRTLTGSVWATPPDPKIVIRVGEDFTPPAPPPVSNGMVPQNSTPADPPPPSWPEPSAALDQEWRPGGTAPRMGIAPSAGSRAAELGRPIRMDDGVPPLPNGDQPPAGAQNPPRTGVRPDRIADENPQARRDRMPCNMDGPGFSRPSGGVTPPTRAIPVPPRQPLPALDAGPARVPSCVLMGQTLHNFALNDLDGRPWEFRHHHGQLILIDFWGTWCVPCLHTIPHLRILQERYGQAGLEVVGIAYENGTPQEQARKVNDVCRRLRVNYRVLLGSDRAKCPVRTQFAVNNWPTLVLIDENGRLLWRSEGLDAQQLQELEVIIRQRLGQ